MPQQPTLTHRTLNTCKLAAFETAVLLMPHIGTKFGISQTEISGHLLCTGLSGSAVDVQYMALSLKTIVILLKQ